MGWAKGQVPLLPKSEGDGYMLSAFVSREFGFGRQMTEDELQRVNMARQTAALGGGNYLDTTAAMEILGTTRKPILLESPFVKYLFIGINNQGYWNSYHMSLQLEDVVDCLRILYPSFDFVFLFDHSQGHARKRDGALSAINMQKNFGGSKQQMRDTVIMSQEGYLGTHSPTLGIGDTQSMVFNTDDCGPWYLTPEQRDLQRHDRIMGKEASQLKTKKTLLEELNEKGVTLQQKRGYTKAELQELARNNSIETHKEVDKILSGWEGKSKGMLQVLWERGLIDPSELDKYTVDGKKDTISGKIDLRYSLRHLIAECADFKDEETALQYLGSQLGITVLLTPKFHAELAGEGIEFCWGHAKAFYRRVPVSQKRGRENFKQLVRDSTCSIKELTKERMGKFASRARAYICTYHHLFESQQRMRQQGRTHNFIATSITEDQGLLYSEIQRLMKLFKSHRCALDFDRGFVNSALKEAKTRNEEDEV
ncbi:hypothetical protein MHU86_11047 [Fragilaria crotonensis]|nr:hypothetical protein MHU86_11047 [Fragilaria crotonensis]